MSRNVHTKHKWHKYKLGDVVNKITKKALPNEFPDFKFIGMDCIEPNSTKPLKVYKFSDFKSAGNLFNKNHVLYGRMRPYLNKVYKAEYKGVCSGEFIVLESNELIDPEFLKYILHSQLFVRFANSITSGDRPRISFEEISEYCLSLPSIDQQQTIVSKIEELFSELDKGLENLRLALQQLKTYRQAVLKWAFEGRLTNENVKEGELPEGWKWVKMGEAANNFDGNRIPLSRIVRAKRKGIYRYYGATEIVDYIDNFIFDGQYLLIGEDGANLLSKVKPLAFIVDGKFWVNNHAHVLQAKDNCLNKYLGYYFNSLNLAQFVTGTAQPKLTQGNLNKIEIPICTIKEQNKIVQEIEIRLSVAEKIEESITQSLQQLEALRQSILKKAFEGGLL